MPTTVAKAGEDPLVVQVNDVMEEKANYVCLEPKKPPSLPPSEKDIPEIEQEKEEEEEEEKEGGAPVPVCQKREQPRKSKSKLLIDQDLPTMEHNIQRFAEENKSTKFPLCL